MRKEANKAIGCLLAGAAVLGIAACKQEVKLRELNLYDILLPDDTLYSQLWGMKRIEMPTAWARRTDCSSIITAVVDTGIDYDHPDFNDNFYEDSGTNMPGKDTRSGILTPFDPADDNLHGTHVAGTIGAQGDNGEGVVGICWKPRLMAVKVLDSSGSGTNADVAAGVDYAVANGAKVINMSLGGTGYSAALDTAIVAARTAGVLVVAAAGNSGVSIDTTPFYPAALGYDNIITVAAVTRDDVIASFSNYSSSSVHIAAPGTDILSTFPTVVTTEMRAAGKTSSYEQIQGTSMAAPHVSGAAALVWAGNTGWTYSQVRARLFTLATPLKSISNFVYGGRRLRLGPDL